MTEANRFEGAPQVATEPLTESMFAVVPELARMANLAVARKKIVEGKGRENLINPIAQDILERPERLTQIFDALALLKETQARESLTDGSFEPAAGEASRSDIYEVDEFVAQLTRALRKVEIADWPPAPAVLEQWLTILTESDLYRPLAEAVLRRMFERCKNPKSTVDFAYELSLGGMTSANPRVFRAVLELLSFQTPLLLPNSRQARYLTLASFDLDDETLRKALEIDGAYYFLTGMQAPDLKSLRDAANNQIAEDPDFTTELDRVATSDRPRFGRLRRFYERPVDEELRIFTTDQPMDFSKFPFNLIRDAGPLRRWFNEQMTAEMSRRGLSAFNLHLPAGDWTGGLGGEDSLPRLIQGMLRSQPPSESAMVDDPLCWQTLAQLIPERLTEGEQTQALGQINETLRQDMRDNTRYLLSPRGDLVEIEDAVLRGLGFQSIQYEMDSRNKRDAVVTVTVEGHRYRIVLDEYFALRDARNNTGVRLPASGVFLENLILSHLHAIRCTDRVVETGAGAPDDRNDGGRVFRGRRAHRHFLPVGQSPSPAQVARVLRDCGVDLVRLNREAVAKGQIRKASFGYEADAGEVAGSEPVRSQAPEATARLRELLRQ